MSLILSLLALDQASNAELDAFLTGVGALVRPRTVNEFGVETGTFSASTRPTRVQVLELMDQAARDIDAAIGADTLTFARPDSIRPLATSVLKLGTAMLIELDFPDSTVYDKLSKLYDARLKALTVAAAQAGAGDQPGSADDELKPIYNFPVAHAAPTRQEYIDRWLSGGR
jgi:hypothetical protein